MDLMKISSRYLFKMHTWIFFRQLSVGVMIMFYVEVDFFFVCVAGIITHMCVCTSSPTGSITISLWDQWVLHILMHGTEVSNMKYSLLWRTAYVTFNCWTKLVKETDKWALNPELISPSQLKTKCVKSPSLATTTAAKSKFPFSYM